MKTYTKEEAIKIIVSGALLYEENLSQKDILFIGLKDGKTSFLEVTFAPYNFLHLTGVVLTKDIAALDFYNKCLDKKLSRLDFKFASDGTTQLKLEVLLSIMRKNLSANMYGDYSGGGINLYTEKVAGSCRGCIGFKQTANGKYIPNTLLNKDVRNTSINLHRIIATYQKNSTEQDYSTLVYKAKRLDFNTIQFPEGYEYLLNYALKDKP